MEADGRGVYQKSIESGKWFLVNILCQRVIGLVTFFILARLLLPEDYGVITAIFLVTGFFNQLTSIPFGDALTQKKGEIEPYLDAVWSFDVYRAILVSVAVFFGSSAIVRFFHFAPNGIALIQVAPLLILIPSLANARQIYFFKNLNFKLVFIRDVVSQLAFSAVAIGFAMAVQANAWALFAGYFAQYSVGTLMSYILYPARPRLTLRLEKLAELFGFSKWIYGQDLLEYMTSQVDKAAVGRLLSPAELGVYARAKDLSTMATAVLTSIISKVGFAAYSKVQESMEKIRRGFLQSVDIILLSTLPFAFILLLEGGAIVRIFLGEKWLLLVVPFKIFAFGNIFLAFNRIVTPVLSALGRPEINFRINLLQLILAVPAMVAGYSLLGFRGLAFAIVVVWILMLLYVIFQARKILNIPKLLFKPAIASGFAACAVALGLDLFFRFLRGAAGGDAYILFQVAGLIIIYYATLLFVSWKIGSGPWSTFYSVAREIGIARQS